MKKIKNVGAFAPSVRQTSKARQNKGITLIALIITIIVMLILVAVTITTAINGGLFEKAGEAVGEMQNALNAEQQFVNDIIEEYFGNSSGEDNAGEETGEVTLPEGLKVGDYVNYTPDTGTYKVASGSTGSGYSSEQSFTTRSNLSWRVWSIDEETGKIEIALASAGSSLYLEGADGYNHAVDILNDLCETLYSKKVNGTKVATGRSINVEDINSKTTYDYTTFTKTDKGFTYGDRKQLSTYGIDYMKYPNLYSQEIGYGTAGTFNTTGLDGERGLKNGTTDESGVTTYPAMGHTDGNTAGTDPYVTYTYYGYGYNGDSYTYFPEQCLDTSLGVNTAKEGLINIGPTYWLASRCVDINSSMAYFLVRCMDSSGLVSASNLLSSYGSAHASSCAIRPIVSLGSKVSLEYDSAKSTSGTTYWTAVF
ncbi:MAG: hypothetical protein J6A29_00465 [Clostridia bacterium]|nr:hypothetical protein [Clostridia bacterium]